MRKITRQRNTTTGLCVSTHSGRIGQGVPPVDQLYPFRPEMSRPVIGRVWAWAPSSGPLFRIIRVVHPEYNQRCGTIGLPRKRCPVDMKGRDTLHAVRTFLQPRFLALAVTASFFPRECRHRSDRYISLLQHRSDRYPSSSPIVVVLAVVLGVFAQQPSL